MAVVVVIGNNNGVQRVYVNLDGYGVEKYLSMPGRLAYNLLFNTPPHYHHSRSHLLTYIHIHINTLFFASINIPPPPKSRKQINIGIFQDKISPDLFHI